MRRGEYVMTFDPSGNPFNIALTEDYAPVRRYHEVLLDLSNLPHFTESITYPFPNGHIEIMEKWQNEPPLPEPPEEPPIPPLPPLPPQLIGPTSTALPRNVGWYPRSIGPTNEDGKLLRAVRTREGGRCARKAARRPRRCG